MGSFAQNSMNQSSNSNPFLPNKSLSTAHSTTVMGELGTKNSNPMKSILQGDNPMEEDGPVELEC